MRTALFIIISSALITALQWTFLSGAFSADEIIIIGNERLPTKKIEEKISYELEKKRLLFIPQKTSLFLINTHRIRRSLLDYFALKNIDIEPLLPHTLSITIEERRPEFIVTENVQNYLVDYEGIIIGPATAEDLEHELLWTIINAPLLSTSGGEMILKNEDLSFLLELQQAAYNSGKGYRIKEIDLSRALLHTITAKTANEWEIILSNAINPEIQLQNVNKALIEMKDQKNELEYIDVRIPSKIFYK